MYFEHLALSIYNTYLKTYYVPKEVSFLMNLAEMGEEEFFKSIDDPIDPLRLT